MHILMPVDGSASALRAVAYVIGHINTLKESPQLLLLNVQWKMAAGNVKLFINQETLNEYYLEQGNEALHQAGATLDAAGLSYQQHISIGTPAEAIAQYALEQQVDLIVMGRQGQSALQTLLLGSVVHKVLHLTSCPVLLIN